MGRINYGTRCGVIPDCSQVGSPTKENVRESICDQLHKQGALCAEMARYCARCEDGGSVDELKHFEAALAAALGASCYDAGPGSVHVSPQRGLPCFQVRLGQSGSPLPTLACIEQHIEQGDVPEGSLEGAKTMLLGCIQQVGGRTRVTVREIKVETGEVLRAGKGDADGTDDRSVQEAAETALRNMGACGRVS
jgi:hypothetical protein